MKYRASVALEAFLLAVAPVHEALDKAPHTYRGLCCSLSKLRTYDPIPVPKGPSQDTIFSAPEVYEALCAWCFETHYNESFDFSVEGTEAAAHQQLLDAHSLAAEYNLTEEDLSVLWCQLTGPKLYAALNQGRNMDEQDRFIACCLRDGREKVLASQEVF